MRTLLALVMLTLSSFSHAGDWPMLGHDPGRSGATGDLIQPPFERKWYRAFPDEGINAGVQPVVASGMVFVPTLHGRLHAIDAESGRDRWSFAAPGPLLHAAAVGEGKVYVGCADGKLYALGVADGKLAWTLQTGKAIWNAPAVWGGSVYVGSRDGKLYSVDVASGVLRWSAATGGPLVNSPAVDARLGRVYIASEDMHVYAFDAKSGGALWQSPKLPGASFRGYHPVIAPDGSVMVTTTPVVCADVIQQILLDMTKEVFGDFASWRHKKEENDRLRKANFELLARPETYAKEMAYLRRRLTEEPDFQTFFTLEPESGRPKFVTPIAYAESMNGTGAPAVVLPDGKVVVKYSALLRSRYEHYSPFLNVGYLDTRSGDIAPIMDQTRTYGWYESLLLVHDEQSQLSAAGRVLINTHQDNVNAMDLDTLKGYGQPWAHNVHEVQPGVTNSIWAMYLAGKELPMGWEWFARGTAVYGGGSAIDVPVSIAGDSFYYLPTHEINAGCTVMAYRMAGDGKASNKAAEPTMGLTKEEWEKIQTLKWDWDLLGMPRLRVTLEKGLGGPVPGTRMFPLVDQAKTQVAKIADAELDKIIETPAYPQSKIENQDSKILDDAVADLISGNYRPLQFPAGKAPGEAFRFFVDPAETLYTLGLAYPHLPPDLQAKAKGRMKELFEVRSYPPTRGEVRSLYEPAPEKLMHISNDLVRSETGRLYPLWLCAHVTGDWSYLDANWGKLKASINPKVNLNAPDLGNADLAGLMAACRIAQREKEDATALLAQTRTAMRERLVYELSYTQGGVITSAGSRTLFGRWHFLTPDVAKLLATYARPVHERLMDVYVDHHRPTWYLAWDLERMWRNEANFSLPTMSNEIFAARAMVLGEKRGELEKFLDIPWCRGDEYYVQKLALTASAPQQ